MTPREHGRLRGNRGFRGNRGDSTGMGGLRGNRGNPAGKGTTPREKDNQQEWGVGEVLQGTGGTQREQVGLAGKELCGKGTPHAGGDSGTDSLGDKWSAVCSEHMLTLRPAPTGHHMSQVTGTSAPQATLGESRVGKRGWGEGTCLAQYRKSFHRWTSTAACHPQNATLLRHQQDHSSGSN